MLRSNLPERKYVDHSVSALNALVADQSEAFAPILLERKANRIRKSVDPEKAGAQQIRTVFDNDDRQRVYF